ncbi:cysteine synthase A [Algoriphagus ratkowskyi]|uniref:N-(2-amino-2-carboxyethyl)-L-glutamate synthase n=1 Tax=Algoriphagus ratkowskyi TaxID=57028 RepID=A0A2W7RKD7_9BACT|nr:2,3-diaminopropionate biosynthesis protein SbnA [Algoriphagus ratkowskyi]PZX61293.1 cysteine synthase A [Algoriphagus ratkowskyi]TXD79403.1 2,3-diaminopropionate biosynthesis protein SbnA [Algoriphagus ratkowskyi]
MIISQSPQYARILDTVGRTPLIRLNRLYPDNQLKIFGKMEAFNPGGSIKDRTALQLITHAMENGELKKGDTVVESSSGNMAIGLAQTCKYFGLNLEVVVDPMVNSQNVKIIKAYGGKVNYVTDPALEGGYLQARLDRVQEILAENPRSFWTNQYGNLQNPAAHQQTMHEIVKDLGYAPDYLFAATSTCGTLMGCTDYVRLNKLKTKIIAVDAVGSIIFGTPIGARKIPGHGAGRKSQFLDRKLISDVVHVNDEECVDGCHRLLNKEAILCGGSSGAVTFAVQKMAHSLPYGATVAMILCDRGERYLDTIYNPEWITKNISQKMEVLV